MDIFWFLPTHGDNRQLGTPTGSRAPTLDYLRQIAEAADRLGFDGALIPTGASCEDAWVAASALIGVTQKLKFLVAIRPGITSPTLSARMAATFDRFSNGRLLVNLVAGGDSQEAKADGLWLDHDQRYDLAGEFIELWRRLLAGESVTTAGQHVSVEQAQLLFAGVQRPHPPIYLGGSSDAAIELVGEQVDVYLTWGEPPAQVAEKIQRVRAAAARHGRRVRFGIRLHVIVRDTAKAAWAAADELIAPIDDTAIARAQAAFANFESEGQRRMSALHQGRRDQLEVAPNLWAGVGLVRGGAGTALVGSADEVAERIREYEALGIDTFILSGYPHLEEAYRVAELLFPRLGHAGGVAPHDGLGGPFGRLATASTASTPTAQQAQS